MTRKLPKTVCIVGSHPATRAMMDFGRTDCQIWLFNEALADPQKWAKKADAVFQMHDPIIWKNPGNRNDPKHYQWLQSGDTPTIYMREQYPDVPKSVRFPLEEVQELLLLNFSNKRYFTSSISYAIALAIYKGFERIELYGVEMATDTEYGHQRDCVAFWTGLAVGRGIDVFAPIQMYDTPYLYGYEGGARLDIDVYAKRVEELTPITADLQARFTDASLEVKSIVDAWDGEIETGQAIVKAVISLSQLGNQFGQADGALQEAQRYFEKCRTMELVADDYLIVRQEYESASTSYAQKSAQYNNDALGVAAQMEETMKMAAKAQNRKARHEAMLPFFPLMNKFIELTVKMGMMGNAGNENKYYMQELDKLTRMAGGEKSEQLMVEHIKAQVQNASQV